MTVAVNRPHTLTVAPILVPMGKIVAMAIGGLFVALVLLFSLFVLLSGMILQMWYVPVVMSALMVLVMSAILVPVAGGFVWLFSRMTRYTLMPEGITQSAGPATRHIGWLEIRRLECDTLFGVTVVRVVAAELDTPITIYHSLLEHPHAFWQQWQALLPHTSVVFQQSEQLVAQFMAQPSRETFGAVGSGPLHTPPHISGPNVPQEFHL